MACLKAFLLCRLHEDAEISMAIGPWHARVHKLSCQAEFGARAVAHTGLTYGDNVEHLWAWLRQHAHLMKYMAPATRQKFLVALVRFLRRTLLHICTTVGKYAYLACIRLAVYWLAMFDCTPGMLTCHIAMHGADVACRGVKRGETGRRHERLVCQCQGLPGRVCTAACMCPYTCTERSG